jgi:hypothetical protein
MQLRISAQDSTSVKSASTDANLASACLRLQLSTPLIADPGPCQYSDPFACNSVGCQARSIGCPYSPRAVGGVRGLWSLGRNCRVEPVKDSRMEIVVLPENVDESLRNFYKLDSIPVKIVSESSRQRSESIQNQDFHTIPLSISPELYTLLTPFSSFITTSLQAKCTSQSLLPRPSLPLPSLLQRSRLAAAAA